MWMAVNQTFSGRWLACMIVPAVTEVCRRQAAHSQVNALVFSAQPFAPPQPGQTKPFGQRRRARWVAQAASSGNRASNWARENGRSCFQRLDMLEHYRNTRATASVCPHILCRRSEGEKPQESIKLAGNSSTLSCSSCSKAGKNGFNKST